jgi:putative PIN family toxin of toxin-antitoxin system
MKVILDTNVVLSGIFFTGSPHQILRHWSRGAFRLVLSPEILDEYLDSANELSQVYPAIDPTPILSLVALHSEYCEPQPLEEPVCGDPDDDKFLACALASRCKTIVSGDKHLLRVSGYLSIQVVRPRLFVDTYLTAR